MICGIVKWPQKSHFRDFESCTEWIEIILCAYSTNINHKHRCNLLFQNEGTTCFSKFCFNVPSTIVDIMGKLLTQSTVNFEYIQKLWKVTNLKETSANTFFKAALIKHAVRFRLVWNTCIKDNLADEKRWSYEQRKERKEDALRILWCF